MTADSELYEGEGVIGVCGIAQFFMRYFGYFGKFNLEFR